MVRNAATPHTVCPGSLSASGSASVVIVIVAHNDWSYHYLFLQNIRGMGARSAGGEDRRDLASRREA